MSNSPIADTRNPVVGSGLLGSFSGGGTTAPATPYQWPSATNLVGQAAQANVANAPALQDIADIVSAINQKSYLSAPGRQQELANINRWQAGELDPSVYQDVALNAAQRYGGAGFGVDSPAWQAAIQRAIVTNRQALQEKGAGALNQLYSGLPTTDVGKYTVIPDLITGYEQSKANEALQVQRMNQEAALQRQQMAQETALREQAFQLQQREYEDKLRAARAAAYAKANPEFGYYDIMGRYHKGISTGVGGF